MFIMIVSRSCWQDGDQNRNIREIASFYYTYAGEKPTLRKVITFFCNVEITGYKIFFLVRKLNYSVVFDYHFISKEGILICNQYMAKLTIDITLTFKLYYF